jgi:hypothetical protein
MKLSTEQRNRLIMVIGAGAIIAGCLWYGPINGLNARLARNRELRIAAKKKFEDGRAKIARADKIEAEKDSAVRALESIEDGMASGADLYRWSFLLMEKARSGHDVEIIDVTRPQTNDVGTLASFPYRAMTFAVKGVAYYHDFGKFLADFENHNPYFRVQNISLANPAEAVGDVVTTRVAKDKLFFKIEVVVLVKPELESNQ